MKRMIQSITAAVIATAAPAETVTCRDGVGRLVKTAVTDNQGKTTYRSSSGRNASAVIGWSPEPRVRRGGWG